MKPETTLFGLTNPVMCGSQSFLQNLLPSVSTDDTPSMQVRFEIYGEGLGYVGPSAAEDDKFIGDTFKRLVKAWTPPFPPGNSKYVDY